MSSTKRMPVEECRKVIRHEEKNPNLLTVAAQDLLHHFDTLREFVSKEPEEGPDRPDWGTALDLAVFRNYNKMRSSWHEPDEQEVSAEVVGSHLDNAHGRHIPDYGDPRVHSLQEFVVKLKVNGEDRLHVNLADTLSAAAGANDLRLQRNDLRDRLLRLKEIFLLAKATIPESRNFILNAELDQEVEEILVKK